MNDAVIESKDGKMFMHDSLSGIIQAVRDESRNVSHGGQRWMMTKSFIGKFLSPDPLIPIEKYVAEKAGCTVESAISRGKDVWAFTAVA